MVGNSKMPPVIGQGEGRDVTHEPQEDELTDKTDLLREEAGPEREG